jgi:recombination protein RecT
MSTELAIPRDMKVALEDRRDEIAGALPEWITPDRFIITTLMAISKNPKLQDCTLQSVYLSILECARIGLFPDGKEAALIPFGKNAELMPMVQGIIRLILRSPGVTKVETRVVHDGDKFAFRYGINPDIDHVPAFGDTKSRSITHAYAIAWRQGTEPTLEVMAVDQIEQARASSRAPNSSAWTQWYGEMARKVVLKRLAKYLDLSPEASRAIEIDHAVTGDPWMEGSVDGVSPDYRNLLVKNQTEAGLARMKDKIEKESELPPEPEPEVIEETEGEGETEKARTKVQRSYPIYMMKTLIDQELADHEKHAVNILNLFPDLALNTSGAKVVELVKIYRQRRKELDEIEAAAVAWNEWKDE